MKITDRVQMWIGVVAQSQPELADCLRLAHVSLRRLDELDAKADDHKEIYGRRSGAKQEVLHR